MPNIHLIAVGRLREPHWKAAADAYAIGRSFATLIKRAGGKRVAVGYDGRLSSPTLEVALVEASKNAGLLVIGSKGRGGFASLLLGSTSRHVLREAYCPVVITRDWAGWKDQAGRRANS